MKRGVGGMLALAGLVVAVMGPVAVAQKAVSINLNGQQQNFVVGPDGMYRVHDDGSWEEVDPANDPLLKGSVTPPAVGGAGNPGVGAKGGGGGVGISPQQLVQQSQERVRQASEDALRKALGSTDPEWAVLLPLIQKVEVLQSAVQPGARLKARAGAAEAPASVEQLAARVAEFEKHVTSSDVSDSQVTQELTTVREARNKVKADLAQARKDLIDVLSLRQEAILFDRGILAD